MIIAIINSSHIFTFLEILVYLEKNTRKDIFKKPTKVYELAYGNKYRWATQAGCLIALCVCVNCSVMPDSLWPHGL